MAQQIEMASAAKIPIQPLEKTTSSPDDKFSDNLDDSQIVGDQRGSPPSPPVKVSFYRTVFFNVSIVGACAFFCPGIFNAMTLTGAGGAQSPYLVNTANALLYALLTITCWMGPFFINKFGYRACLVIGTLGYPLYAGGLYANKVRGIEWLVLLGAALTGALGGIFWSVEGAIAMGYPAKDKVGFYLALWLAFRNSGSVIGSAINVGLNHSPTSVSALSSSTYIVFIVLQCFGPIAALFLSEPGKVTRPDGSSVEIRNKISIKAEASAIYQRVLKDWRVLILMPLMIYLTWYQPYSGTYLALYFSTRSRALASLVASILSVVANFAMGAAVDYKGSTRQTRARFVFLSVMVLNLAMWVWQTIMQVHYLDDPPVRLDWTQSGWYRGWGVYIMANVLYNMNTNLIYWIIAALARTPQDLTRLSGFARGVESVGACGGFGMNSKKGQSLLIPLAFNFALGALGFFVAIPSILRIGEKDQPVVEAADTERNGAKD